MSFSAPVAFVQQYSTNVSMLLQQQGSRLRPSVQVQAFTGKAASVVEQFGAVTPSRNLPRHADTPLISTPQDKRWAYPADYDWADLIDDQDKLRELIDPTSPFVKAGASGLSRAMDDEIIQGIFSSNFTGENGTTATGLLSAFGSGSQAVASNVGASSATGLNVSKLIAAKEILMSADIDLDNDQLFCGITSRQHTQLLKDSQINSTDYNDHPVLVNGMIRSFLGFNFIHTQRIPGGPNFNVAINPSVTGYTTGSQWMVPFWAKSGVCLGMWNDIKASVDRRPDKRNSMQVYVTGTFGATRLEEKRVGFITCV